MMNPIATYRFQFHKEFTFQAFEELIPYLQKLGVSTVYASPVFSATPGSTHGYDGVDPHHINPEIGNKDQLLSISQRLKGENINWLQDIVPNHMAFHPENEWLMDVLEKGPQSVYASFFDEAWSSSFYHGRIMVPFLGSSLEEVIRKNELKIRYANQRLSFDYFGSTYPLQPRSYSILLSPTMENAPDAVAQLLEQLPKMEEEKTYASRWEEIRLQLASLMKNETVKDYITKRLDEVNKDHQLLLQIAGEQSYRLCHWQETDARINYRRFFTINSLICLNIQDENVFHTYHQLIRSLLEEGVFQGLRIDHIDGLYDPFQYLQRLRKIAGDETYIIVEKILEPGESLPKNWPVQGNTGYDFLSLVNNLLTQKNNEQAFNKFYEQLLKDRRTIHQQLHDKKAYILYNHMAGELENLFHLFMESNIVDKRVFAAIRKDDLKEAIAEFLIQCPVYRYYGNSLPLSGEEADAIQNILNRVRRNNPDIKRAVNILEEALLRKPHEGDEERNKRAAIFYQRCMQFTGPLMAKGVEDTMMYTFNRFIGHNEVGDSHEAFGMSVDEFHQAMIERQKFWPLSLNATSTHDTKRGEDVRARLNVLTDLSDEWLKLVKEWQQQTKAWKQENKPDVNDEYFIYQTIVGAYPMPGQEEDQFTDRLQEYIQKALREAKTNSNWTSPDEAYERASKEFAVHLLNKKTTFWKSFQAFHKKIADHGIVNSLAQVLLKFTCPGTPDVYQGCELWDLSLVDPDNRRPIDYKKRAQWLEELVQEQETNEDLLKQLWEERYNGKIKLWLTTTLFYLRKQQQELFSKGDYIPLKVEGAYQGQVFAFARKYKQNVLIIAVPLHTAQLCKDQGKDILDLDWKDTRIVLPKEIEDELQSILVGASLKKQRGVWASQLFSVFPVAILKARAKINERGAGILMHISSLPSPFGIGDMGSEARSFADFLKRSYQKYWQLLPLNPTEAGQGHSPYSAISAKAGNPLLISPELLVQDDLLEAAELQQYFLPQDGKTNFEEAERIKNDLLSKAYQNFREDHTVLHAQFRQFSEQEADWLNDFALYMVLKNEHGGQPWYQWPEELKLRKPEAIKAFSEQKEMELEKIKWIQFIFSKQWRALKEYCNSQNIELVGDLPFYISYDSSDVWSHPEIFAIDEQGNTTGMAGVPPDAFSADGQLWGMPVFKWEVLKEQNYKWWIERISKNRELFDLIRIDHFRAFADYWEVPAGEKTAKNGQWKPGPREDFFITVEKELGILPFIAEDLGEINETVFDLRDQFDLPGMKVLQFAFGEDMPESDYIPHNYKENFVVYTGTHDNNTTKGWFRKDADGNTRKRIEQYTGRSVSEHDVHWILGRMAYGSTATIAILPLQDVLGLDESARMNVPSSSQNNWAWRLFPGQLNQDTEKMLQEWTWLFNRR